MAMSVKFCIAILNNPHWHCPVFFCFLCFWLNGSLFFRLLWEGSTACGLLMSSVCSETICPWMASLTTIRLDYVIDQLGCTSGTEYRKCPSSVISVCCPSILSVKFLFMSPLCFLADDPKSFLSCQCRPNAVVSEYWRWSLDRLGPPQGSRKWL